MVMEEIHYYQQLIKAINRKLEDENLPEEKVDKLLDQQEEYLAKISEIRNAFVNSQ